MRAYRVLVLLAVALFGGLVIQLSRSQGCSTPTLSSDVVGSSVPRSNNALIADVSVRLAAPAPIYLEYGSKADDWLRTPVAAEATEYMLPLMRMRPNRIYEIRAVTLNSEGCPQAVGRTSATTGGLPDLLRDLQVTTSGDPTLPLVLFEYRPENGNRWLVALDDTGVVRWYYRLPRAGSSGSRATFVRRDNGNLLYLDWSSAVTEITMNGRVVRNVPLAGTTAARAHHDLTELPGNRVLLAGEDEQTIDDRVNGGPANLRLVGDTLHVLNLDTGDLQQVWSVFTALDPTQRLPEWTDAKSDLTGTKEWTHLDSLSVGPSGNILVSFRLLNQVVSLSPDFSRVEWRLGRPGSDFAFPDSSDQFYGQHAVKQLQNGHILMFDNGNFRSEGEFSRALELQLDTSTRTARKVWEYRGRPDIYSDASAMPSGEPADRL
jgi:hypothetical protein